MPAFGKPAEEKKAKRKAEKKQRVRDDQERVMSWRKFKGGKTQGGRHGPQHQMHCPEHRRY